MSDQKKPNIVEQKWGREIANAGWTAVPNIILEKLSALGLDALDFAICVYVMSFQWKADGLAWPSKVTMAKSLGVDKRTIQRRITAMQAAGFIRREAQKGSSRASKPNIYHLDGLKTAAIPFAIEKVNQRESQKMQNRQRIARKKPKLTVV